MKIIIAGAGEVGFHLAKLLSFESQDITLIDTSRESLAYADTHLDIRVVRGDATSIAVLKDSKVDGTDLVIAVTSSETTNITVCVLSKQLGAKRTIARISNTEFIDKKDEVIRNFSSFKSENICLIRLGFRLKIRKNIKRYHPQNFAKKIEISIMNVFYSCNTRNGISV